MPGTVSIAAADAADAGVARAALAPGEPDAARSDDAAGAGWALQSRTTRPRTPMQTARKHEEIRFKSEAPGGSLTHNAARGAATTRKSPTCDLALDRLARARDDQVDAGAPGRRAGATRIAVHAVGRAEGAAVAQQCRANELLVNGERQRGVGGAGVRADLGIGQALLAQGLREVALGDAVVLLDR